VIDRTDSNNHYVKKELSDRYFWKDQKHIVELICENFGVVPKSIEPDLIFSENEIKENSQKMVLPEEDFITVEPNGKTDYFAQNRLWFFDRWQELINQLSEFTQIIQVGDDNGKSLSNVINLNGNLTFREATWVISQSRLFVSTIGGLMHAARAVETKSVILYAGTEKNKMAGYSDNINMTKYVECSPCGLKVECPYGKECMDFSVEEIYEKVLENIIDARK
jgi:ADP-heptose:LPS heptosyltransferase